MRWRAIVERVRTLVQRRRDGRESGKDGGGVGTAGKQCSETSAVGFAACIYAGRVDVVGRGDDGDHVIDVGNLVKVSLGKKCGEKRVERRPPGCPLERLHRRG